VVTPHWNPLFIRPASRTSPSSQPVSAHPIPPQLLAASDLSSLFNELLSTYDRIIIDSAPVNAVSDALVIAPHVHKTILVVRAGKTPRKAILRCIMLLKKAQATIGGFVLNRLPTGRTAGYYYYYYGDKYEKDSPLTAPAPENRHHAVRRPPSNGNQYRKIPTPCAATKGGSLFRSKEFVLKRRITILAVTK
jgi:hypothetical protein